jgi:hypothetical protein
MGLCNIFDVDAALPDPNDITRMILRLFRLDSPVRLYGSTYDPNLLL